jgi:hypothetical protein
MMQDAKKKPGKSQEKTPFSFERRSPDEKGSIHDAKYVDWMINFSIFEFLFALAHLVGHIFEDGPSKFIDAPFAVSRRRLIGYSARSDDAVQQLAISNLYFINQIRKCWTIAIICFVSTILIFILGYFLVFAMPMSTVVFLLTSVVMLAYVRSALIAYRISNGYFGSNRAEATDLISFIVNNTDDIDSSGGKKMNKAYQNNEHFKGQESVDGLEGASA